MGKFDLSYKVDSSNIFTMVVGMEPLSELRIKSLKRNSIKIVFSSKEWQWRVDVEATHKNDRFCKFPMEEGIVPLKRL